MSQEEKDRLNKEWLKFKKAENKAKESRQDIEKEIEDLHEFEGKSKTFTEGKFKVSIKKNFVQKLDQEKWIKERKNIPEELRPEKIKFELSGEGFDWLRENNREIYLKVSNCVEEKQNKTTIKVEKI